MSDGTLSVRRKDVRDESELQPLDAFNTFFDISQNSIANGKSKDPDELRLHMRTSRKLKEYDRFLKNFKYSAALDCVLKKVSFKFALEIAHSFRNRIYLQQRHLPSSKNWFILTGYG